MSIKVIAFDFNGIFVEPIEFHVLENICRQLRFGRVIAVSNYILNIHAFEKGRLSPMEFWQRVFPPLDENQYKGLVEAEYEKPLEANSEVYALAKTLSEKLDLYCISNSNFLQGKALRKQKLYSPFKRLFLSHEVHHAKPFPRIYAHFLEETGLKARECIFIDDSRRNLITAKLLGFRTMKFMGAKDLEQRLKKSKIL